MEQDTDKLIEDQLKSLPEPLQHAIALTQWRIFVRNIAKANHLESEKSDSLERETMFVIYGFESQDDFIKNIINELPTDINKATLLAEEINKQVFSTILNKAEELANENPKETLQSIVSANTQPKEETSLASTVIVEKHSDLPMVVENKPKTSLTFEERKKLVPNLPKNNSHYADKIDPYREPI